MAKIEPIRRWEKNSVFWRTEAGQVLGFQSNFIGKNTMIISDGKGMFHTAIYGVVDCGKICTVCRVNGCNTNPKTCNKREDNTACRYYHDDGTPRNDEEVRYYVELEEES